MSRECRHPASKPPRNTGGQRVGHNGRAAASSLVHFRGEKRKRETSEEHNVRNGEKEKERRGEAREESGRGTGRWWCGDEGSEPTRGVRERERGVLRPTPRSMLSSEVPVGGGCAEFPAVERRTPVFFSPRANPFLFYFSSSSSPASSASSPACSGMERERIPSPPPVRNNGRLFRQSFNRLSTGSSSLPVRSPRERKYGGRSVATGRRHRDAEIHTRTVTYKRTTLRRQMRQSPAIVRATEYTLLAIKEQIFDLRVRCIINDF